MTTSSTPGTRNGQKRKAKATMTDEEIAQASLTQNIGVLNNPQATMAAHLLRAQYTQEQLAEGKIIPLTWEYAGAIMHQSEFCKEHPGYKELYGSSEVSNLVELIKQVFPYDRKKWETHRKFVCRDDKRDMNGKSPSLGIVLLPIAPFRQP